MKIHFVLCIILASSVNAQTIVNKTVSVNPRQKIVMKFDYPELIKVSTWDKNEISVAASVRINNGENDAAFEIIVENKAELITIENIIKNLKNLPQVITVVDGSQKISFSSKEEFKKYKADKGRSFDMVSHGVDMEIIVEVKVPKNSTTSVTSTYGMVEVKDFFGPLSITAQYGGVDAALSEKQVGELSAETNYGQIYSNLSFKFDGDGLRERDFYTFVFAKLGNGPRYEFESKYGNVYLRKAN